jgi:hypothetical protein
VKEGPRRVDRVLTAESQYVRYDGALDPANPPTLKPIKLENEGWERDLDVTEPTEPTFTVPA